MERRRERQTERRSERRQRQKERLREIEKERERETERDWERERDWETERERERKGGSAALAYWFFLGRKFPCHCKMDSVLARSPGRDLLVAPIPTMCLHCDECWRHPKFTVVGCIFNNFWWFSEFWVHKYRESRNATWCIVIALKFSTR